MKPNVYIVTGTSGAGKTTIIPDLRDLLNDFVVYDGDSIQIKDYNVAKCNWLRIARSNALSNIGTVICSTIVPENLVECDHLEYFENIFYINLEIEDDTVIKRLQNRNWNKEMIDNYVHFSNWLKQNKNTAFNPPLHVINTEDKTPLEVAKEVVMYIKSTNK